MTKKNESKVKAFRFTITANANSVTSATAAINTVVTALTKIGNGIDENLKDLTLEQLKSVYMGKGEADGCAAVFKAIFESEEYSVKRFAPKIKDFAVRCGLRLNGVVPSSLKLPEGVDKEPSEASLCPTTWVRPSRCTTDRATKLGTARWTFTEK